MQRYSSGIGNYLDVLSIEQQLLQAQRQLATLNAAQIDLSIQLMQALWRLRRRKCGIDHPSYTHGII